MLRISSFLVFHLLLLLLAISLAGCSTFGSQERDPLADNPLDARPAPQDAGAGIAKGMNLERAGQLDKARECYEGVLKHQPDEVEPLHRLAVLADKQRRHAEAQTLYMRAIQLAPRDAQLFNDLGYSFYLSGNLPKAESAVAKAVQLEPTSPRFRNNLGMIVGQQGRIEEAFNHFATAGSEADAHYNVAFIYACQDRADDAQACFQRALAIDPTHEKAGKALASFARYEENGGLAIDDSTPDGRRWIPYVENSDGQPNIAAMTNFGITHDTDSALPAAHNMPGNREAGAATRTLHNDARTETSMASNRE